MCNIGCIYKKAEKFQNLSQTAFHKVCKVSPQSTTLNMSQSLTGVWKYCSYYCVHKHLLQVKEAKHVIYITVN